MCIVSMVFDEYGKTPIQPWIPPVTPAVPWSPQTFPAPTLPPLTFKPETPLDIFEELVAVAAKLDKALGLPDCEDPSKAAWLEKVRAAIREHAAKETERRLAQK